MKLPVIIMLALMPLVLTAYAEAPSHVDVYDYPFNITLLEGGNFTLYNNGTNTISFSGSFPGTVEVDSQETFELPVYYFNAPNTYYLRDMSLPDTYMSTVTLVKPTPVYVPPTPSFSSTSNETLGSFEPIDEPTDMTTYNELMVIPPPIPYCVNDPEWCAELERLEQVNATSNESTPVTTTESSDTEVLNLRLQILKVIESIFKIVLQ